ncbi:hypothetical protein DEU56DRAFT_778836 [Suillus clintonianus]|uniref:uncharacterized protein n=1 Tax=Suillus clintonianus TaxID=1904413 RepID=UPI001B87330B|nr:uncharacterized protein DEU56DRAFT_778836 [Suillus clintonianus]KAG2150856.1 hypothetical protein DEU56DRAFT_778836 [Suillus clintonianus]
MQRSQKASSSSDSSPSPTLPGSHAPQLTAIRTESKAELKPLFTLKPLSFSDREKKPSPPPRKRRRQIIPETPALTFNPSQRMIPSGRQEPTQTPVSQLTPISSTNEFFDEADDQPPPDTSAHAHSTASKRPRASSGSDDSPQLPSYPATYYNFRYADPADHYDSPLSGSSSSPATSYGSSPAHHHYGADGERQPFHQEMTGQHCADYTQPPRREVYGDPSYLSPQEGVPWSYGPTYPNVYRD